MSRKRGDVINNGKIGVEDAIHILGHIADISTFQIKDQESLRAGDVNSDGYITSSDVNYFLNNLVGNPGYNIESLFTYKFNRIINQQHQSTVNYSEQTEIIKMVNEIHIAFQDSTPMILFVGQVGRKMRDREAFQEIDFRRMFGQMTKWVAEIDDAARVPEYVSRAFHTAVAGRPGPVLEQRQARRAFLQERRRRGRQSRRG